MTDAPRGLRVNGPAIKQFRLLQGASQAAIAAEAGISFQYLSDIEREQRRSVNADVVDRLAAALRVDRRTILASPHQAATPAVSRP